MILEYVAMRVKYAIKAMSDLLLVEWRRASQNDPSLVACWTGACRRTSLPLIVRPYEPHQKAVGDQAQERVYEASDSIAQDAVGKLKGSHSTILSSGGGRTIVFRRTVRPREYRAG